MDDIRPGVAALERADFGAAPGAEASGEAPSWDRYAHWPRPLARVALGILVALVLLAALTPGYAPPPPAPPKVNTALAAKGAPTAQDDDSDNDLRLYRVINARVARGDNYYVAATEEQRRNNYPVAPGLTVRLPTLAFLTVWLGTTGMEVLALALFAGMIVAIFRRLADEPGADRYRPMAGALMMAGIASGLNQRFEVLHEIWAAQLIGLSLALHRPQRGKWIGAWLAAAGAVAIRELALPFVVLMAAHAAWGRRWRELAGWLALIALFGVGLAIHLHLAEAQIRAGDPQSPPWLVFGGLASLFYKISNSTFLSLLPVWLSGPAIVFMMAGWTGWRSPLGNFATLLTLGYGLAFMIAGRANNFYWGILIAPVLFMGGAFLILTLPSLWHRAMSHD